MYRRLKDTRARKMLDFVCGETKPLDISDESEIRSSRTCITTPRYRESASSNDNKEPYSPAVSEYAPSLNPSRSSSPVQSLNMTISSSLVRDVTLAMTDGFNTPPTRSTNDFQFSTPSKLHPSFDFIASPNVIYKINTDVSFNNNMSEQCGYIEAVHPLLTEDNCSSLTNLFLDNLNYQSSLIPNSPNSFPSNLICIRDKTICTRTSYQCDDVIPLEPVAVNNDLVDTNNISHHDEGRVYVDLLRVELTM